MKRKKLLLHVPALLLCLAPLQKVKAQFTNDTVNNTLVRDTAQYYGSTSQIVTAPNGKSYIIWSQPYNGGNFHYKMRVQLLDKYGYRQWDSAGVVVDSMIGSALYVDRMNIDKEGNLIYATQDERTAQYAVKPVVYKIDQAGNFIWGNSGIQLVDTTDNTNFSGGASTCITDNNNVVVAYYSEGATRTYITFQKFDPTGTPLWATPKQIIAPTTPGFITNYERPVLVSTGGENFIMVYVNRSGSYTYNLNAQKYDSQGNAIWAAPTVVSTQNFPNYGFPSVSTDGYGGAIVTFQSGNPLNATIPEAYIQRVYADGHTWNAAGKEMITDGGTGFKKTDGGSFFAPDANCYFASVLRVATQNSFLQGVNIQKIDTAGSMLFSNVTGSVLLPMSSGSGTQDIPSLASFKKMDTGMVAIYTIGMGPSPMTIYSAKVDYSGAISWPFNPAALSTINSVKSRISAGDCINNQVVIAWTDTRTVGTSGNSSYSGGIYAQNVRIDGTRGIACQPVSLAPLDTVLTTTPAFTLTGGLPLGGTYSGTGVNNGMFTPATAGVGTFTIKYVYSDGPCTDSATRTITVLPFLGINTIAQNDLFACYPNPASGQFTLMLKQNIPGNVTVKITSLDGRVVLADQQTTGGNYQKNFNLTGYAKGIYMVTVSTKQGTATTRLVLQ
jgi:hypothetical protein